MDDPRADRPPTGYRIRLMWELGKGEDAEPLREKEVITEEELLEELKKLLPMVNSSDDRHIEIY